MHCDEHQAVCLCLLCWNVSFDFHHWLKTLNQRGATNRDFITSLLLLLLLVSLNNRISIVVVGIPRAIETQNTVSRRQRTQAGSTWNTVQAYARTRGTNGTSCTLGKDTAKYKLKNRELHHLLFPPFAQSKNLELDFTTLTKPPNKTATTLSTVICIILYLINQ